ncbi:Adenylosuccinate lyase [Lachnellula occidentalis]|uniref:Adenylosuccinate lyase n=1 Tax=Lachnellula occidentalis TaxID=215460 RepID=A0A8H8U4B1_9HELO|nr:Adenylosuccinate lyase [Lachnellula occidentalis]
MSGNYDTYQTPLASRYASAEMKAIFSARTRSSTWRQLWVWLAEAEKELGIDIPDKALAQMQAHITMTDEDFIVAAVEEKRRRHDVMAHVHAYGLVAPAAAGIIHYGATSCYVTDNSDLIFLRDGLDLILPKLATIIFKLSQFAIEYKDMPTLGYSAPHLSLFPLVHFAALKISRHITNQPRYVIPWFDRLGDFVDGTTLAHTAPLLDNAFLSTTKGGNWCFVCQFVPCSFSTENLLAVPETFDFKLRSAHLFGYLANPYLQLITVGRRTAQWIQDLLMVLEDITRTRSDLRFRGAQGTTGTQASFMEIFHGDGDKVDKLNEILCAKAGFPTCYTISTQTYSRLVDLRVVNALSEFGAVVQRITGDIRHLASQKEMEEPFEKDQIGSSAMAYVMNPPQFPPDFASLALPYSKRNPMRCERIAGLGRHLSNLNKNASDTYSAQWFERTLDDSAIRRITIPEAFLSADAICMTLDNVVGGLVVYPARIHSRVMEELPFMATENIIMKLVSLGKSRQEAHEEVRVLSHQASDVVKKEGGRNDLIERIKKAPFFQPIVGEIDGMLDPKNFIGRCPEQVLRFCGKGSEVEKALEPYRKHIAASKEVDLIV